ncbi:mapeg family protein (macronuclear) [Tetrahymena thermophila SB210]|uniref:Mapeg family protein n=1 Tax=Tetrahymena thermophila (strain SB210) TaxID=312017 RepID=Q22T36_TETTS|nr:mapeg family protein [Tetrahymena thermophila SB210]EAR88602.1 mapeg family protein [Tetrahymena thermophila SB210]|eukprot:XP_001008847.1 mapeg family protein [Tetrahymena thermophila SB210]
MSQKNLQAEKIKEQHVNEDKEVKKSKSKKLGYINQAVATICTAIVLICFYQFCNYQENQVKLYETKLDLIKRFDNESKQYIVLKIGYMLATFILILTFSVMVIRIATGRSNPISFQDPKIIITLNRIIQNSLEQGFIFMLNYAFFIYFNCDQIKALKSFVLGCLFIKARYIFLFSYVIGAFTGVTSFRAIGFTLNVIIQVAFALENFGIPVLNIYI